MIKKNSYLIIGILIVLSMSIITSLETGVIEDDDIGIDLIPKVLINYTKIWVNSSDFWDNFDTPMDIDISLFPGETWVNESGDNMTGDLNMDQSDIWMQSGELGIGTQPSPTIGIFNKRIATGFAGTAEGLRNQITTDVGSSLATATGLDNRITLNGLSSTGNGFLMSVTSNHNSTTSRGFRTVVSDAAGKVNQKIYGGEISTTMYADSLINGLRITENDDGAITNPSNVKHGIYTRWDIPTSDANQKKWTFFNDGSTVTSSKIFLGKDDIKTFWGTGFDAAIYYDGKDFIINPKELGSGKVEIPADLNVTGNFTGNQIYGEMWYHNHTGTIMNFASSNTWYYLFFTNATSLNGFTYVGGFNASSNLTAQVSGKYQVNYMSSGSGQNNHQYFSTILINGVEQEQCGSHKKMSAGGDIVTMTGSCFIDLNVGDDVSSATMDYTGTGDGEYYSSNLNLVRIGD